MMFLLCQAAHQNSPVQHVDVSHTPMAPRVKRILRNTYVRSYGILGWEPHPKLAHQAQDKHASAKMQLAQSHSDTES